MLDLHPEVDLRVLQQPRRDAAVAPSLDGAELVELLSAEQTVVTAALRRGHTAEEVVYPFGREERDTESRMRCPGSASRWRRD